MAWRTALVCLFVAAFVAAAGHDAAANGRAPATSTIHFRQGNERDIAVGLTFGLLISHDAGASWKWICEDAVGYKGMYDPVYVYTPQGSLFATTYDGYKVTRNGCTFDATSSGTKNVSASAQGSDGALYYAAAQLADNTHTEDFKIYRSIDDGETFAPVAATPDKASWWQTLQVAPSDPKVLYLSGYFFQQVQENGKTVVYKRPLMFRSDNAGASWTKLSTAELTVASSSQIDIVGISSSNPQEVFIRVEAEANSLAETIYRSTNGGASWAAIRHKDVQIYGFVVRKAMNSNGKHDWVLMTQNAGAEVSHDEGATWQALANAPHANCLVEHPMTEELWACTQNYGFNGAPSDMAGIMKSKDLATWTKVLKYEDLTEAASCAAGTIQQDACVAMQWCGVCAQLSCHPAAMYNCPVPTEAPVTQPKSDGGGCCQTGDSGTGAMALGLLLGTVLLRPRRRRG